MSLYQTPNIHNDTDLLRAIWELANSQATDGVTNRVVPPFTRSLEKTGTFTTGTGYTVTQAIGVASGSAILTIATGLAPGTRVRVANFQIALVMASFAAFAAPNFTFYDSAPAAVNDGATPTFTAAEAAKIKTSIAGTSRLVGTTNIIVYGSAPLGDITVDASGNIYCIITTSGTITITTPGVSSWVASLLY